MFVRKSTRKISREVAHPLPLHLVLPRAWVDKAASANSQSRISTFFSKPGSSVPRQASRSESMPATTRPATESQPETLDITDDGGASDNGLRETVDITHEGGGTGDDGDCRSPADRLDDDAFADLEVDRGTLATCGGFRYEVPDMVPACAAYPFAMHSVAHLPWTFSGTGSKLSLHASPTSTSRGCTGVSSPDGGPCTPCGALAFNTKLKGALSAPLSFMRT